MMRMIVIAIALEPAYELVFSHMFPGHSNKPDACI